MHPVLVVLGLMLLGLVLSAARSLVAASAVGGVRAHNANPLDVPSLLNILTGRHPDGTAHRFGETVPLGVHSCESVSYCHHERMRCACGASRVSGYAVAEVR